MTEVGSLVQYQNNLTEKSGVSFFIILLIDDRIGHQGQQ